MLLFGAITILFGVSLGFVQKDAPPQWSPMYTVKGLINIPYAELHEPFYAWYDSENGRSRIDYYGTMVKTYQLTAKASKTPFGTLIKIAPVTTETVLNQQTCLQVNASSADDEVQVQSILPDLTDYKYLGKENINANDAHKWQLVLTTGDKLNKYTMWLKYKKTLSGETIPIPIRYEMKGYNTLLGSHYDHYYLDYESFDIGDIDPSVFHIDDYNHSEKELLYFLCHKLKENGKKALAKAVKQMVETNEVKKKNSVEDDKALALCTALSLSKWQYLILRSFLKKECECVLPSYHNILSARKRCYPAEDLIEITEKGASVRLQALLDHTSHRIKQSLNNIGEEELKLIWKWGLDGSSSQSNYKQKFSEPEFDDSSVVMTSAVPLRLITHAGAIVWENPCPGSTSYCRPIKFHFQKETADIIKEINSDIKDQIERLVPSQIGATKCSMFPGPGVRHVVLFNPMKEFMHSHEEHLHEEFTRFKSKHNKQYLNQKEHEHRLNIFRQNLRFIMSHNRAGKTFSVGVNHLADRTDEELAVLRGRVHSGSDPLGLPFPHSQSEIEEESVKLPPEYDWRLFGAVTPVKDQSVCGSCWSFGTIGAVEGALFLHNGGHLVRLSQQALVDCSWGFGNNGCDGGEDFRAYKWIMKHGLPTEEDYGGYLGQDGYCHIDNVTLVTSIKGWVNVTSNDVKALKLAIFKQGPISVAIDASHKSFSFYSHGVYYEPQCKNNIDGLDHAVLAVGYGVLNGHAYWLVKNSWSNMWGNDGYVLMSARDNNCGVETCPTYVIM